MDIVRKKKVNNINSRDIFLQKNKAVKLEKEKPSKQDRPFYDFGQSFDVDDKFSYEKELEYIRNKFPKPKNPESVGKLKKGIFDIRQGNRKRVNAGSKKIWISSLILFFLAGGVFYFGNLYLRDGLNTQKEVLGESKEAYGNINGAIDEIKNKNFALSAGKFKEAYESFSKMSNSLEGLGKGVIVVSRFVPGVSKISSGYYLTEAGKQLSLAGEKISNVANTAEKIKEKSSGENSQIDISVLGIFLSFEKDLGEIENYLLKAQENLDKVKTSDIPKENQNEIITLKTKLPIIIATVKEFSNNSHIMADFLGANGPRKYLFLFQNNQEIRPTGGFIGSYGVLDIDGSGRIRKFFIDGIFNPDGQLLDKVVPPKPIQKISAAWSLHDSNWFPNFPTSAKKAMLFYEKTGGPTVDGVITLTPTVIQKFLDITGPIEMPEYGVTLDKDNFIQNIQYEVEVDYDKEENRPKKILSDLAPIILDKLSQSRDAKTILSTTDVLNDALKEKHILLYFNNEELQGMVSQLGWSGEVRKSNDDYLSVINTNVNGYKTDGVVDEKISQEVTIFSNGEIVDTVTIKRRHNGGATDYEWWNKVNSDYMRVYVPKGAELLEVEGQTREINEDVLDYNSLNFERDPDVEIEESQMKIDSKTGTRVYTEGDKTVFANWVYVSPQEEVIVKYKYKLPFKFSGDIRAYSLLAQKQSGSMGSGFDLDINYPKNWKVQWQSDGINNCNSEDKNLIKICLRDNLKTDKFAGAVFLDK